VQKWKLSGDEVQTLFALLTDLALKEILSLPSPVEQHGMSMVRGRDEVGFIFVAGGSAQALIGGFCAGMDDISSADFDRALLLLIKERITRLGEDVQDYQKLEGLLAEVMGSLEGVLGDGEGE